MRTQGNLELSDALANFFSASPYQREVENDTSLAVEAMKKIIAVFEQEGFAKKYTESLTALITKNPQDPMIYYTYHEMVDHALRYNRMSRAWFEGEITKVFLETFGGRPFPNKWSEQVREVLDFLGLDNAGKIAHTILPEGMKVVVAETGSVYLTIPQMQKPLRFSDHPPVLNSTAICVDIKSTPMLEAFLQQQ